MDGADLIRRVPLYLAGLGCIFLLASIVLGARVRQIVPPSLKPLWASITGLMVFFLAGYVLFMVAELQAIAFPAELTAGIIFLAGSLFVFIVVGLTGNTLRRVHEGETELAETNLLLRGKNEELLGEVQARRQAEEQAMVRLGHLATLRAIDTMITSSLDLHVTLQVFLDQLLPHLKVDAADILLLNPHTLLLEFAAGQGFRSTALHKSRERLGEGSAGLAALERRTIHIASLPGDDVSFDRMHLAEAEEFVAYYAVPLAAKGQVKGVLEIFQRTRHDPDPEWFGFLESLAALAAIAIDNATMFNDLQRSSAKLVLAYDTTIEGWAKALELRDEETEGHTQRTAEMTLRIARAFDMSEEELVHVRRGALLHDIGKMAIPDAVLLKTGSLTEQEQALMQEHPVHAFTMLSPIAYLRPALDIPYAHHERWDGAGYPRGLKGEQIPLAARIFAVADTWDALRSVRRYHPAWSAEKVRAHIASLAGSQFDPAVVKVFLALDWGEDAPTGDVSAPGPPSPK